MKALLECGNAAGFRPVVDSAFGRNGQPWFVPDFGSDWQWSAMLAFRICRLGKSVSAKFAPRYVDAVTALFVPSCDSPEAPVLLECMDGAAVAGDWVELPQSIEVNGVAVDFDMQRLYDFIALVSGHVTLKTGDIVALSPAGMPSGAVEINGRIEIDLNGVKVLRFNMK